MTNDDSVRWSFPITNMKEQLQSLALLLRNRSEESHFFNDNVRMAYPLQHTVM